MPARSNRQRLKEKRNSLMKCLDRMDEILRDMKIIAGDDSPVLNKGIPLALVTIEYTRDALRKIFRLL